MDRTKKGLGVLTVSLSVVLAALAFAAATAQALPEYYVENTLLAGTAKYGGEGGIFRLLIPGLSLTFKCTSENDNGEIKNPAGSAGISEGEMNFTGCDVEKMEGGKEKEIASCEVLPFTIKIRDRLITHAGEVYDLILPLIEGESEELGTIKLKGEECTLKSSYQITGSTAALYPGGGPQEVKALTFSRAIDELICTSTLGTKLNLCNLFAGGSRAYIDGVTNQALLEGFLNKKWEAK
jgi:hypothetical protein